MILGVSFFLLLGLFLAGLGFFLSSPSYLCCLVILENLNLLLLGCCLMEGVAGFRVSFIALLVMFTLEVVLGLLVLVRIWSFGGLIGFVGW